MEWRVIFLAIGAMVGLGTILSVVLAVANRKLYVFVDPRIEQVESMLPGTNCGACGQPGCAAFSEALVDGGTSPSACTVSGEEERESIAQFLGVAVGDAEKRVARLACAGSANVSRQRARYMGEPTCQAANLVAGGGKGCAWGCLGLGDCFQVCEPGAIRMSDLDLPIVDEALCTACGECVEICPKGLFELHPITHRLWVACKNEAFGDEAEDECEVACNACGRCVADGAEGLLRMENNLPIIDYNQIDRADPLAIQRCPTGAIVWISPKGNITKGKQAKSIVRHMALPVG